MAVSYVARKCTQCAGKLEYVNEKKMWRCLYCGAEVEREETYDGLFTIKNVVRQVLLDVAYRRMDAAAKNLVECEKIDPRYVGTLIAKITYQMVAAITPGACEQVEIKNMFTRLKKNYGLLCEISETVSDEEEALYQFCESSEIYATLLLVYDSLNDEPRKNHIYTLLKPAEIYAREANKNLLSYAVKYEKYDVIEAIVANGDNVDLQFAFSEILTKYRDGESKRENIAKLCKLGAYTQENREDIEAYLRETTDSLVTKVELVKRVYEANIRLKMAAILDHVLAEADGDTAMSVLSVIAADRLVDADLYQIVELALLRSPVEKALAILACLESQNQYISMPPKYVIDFLGRKDVDTKEWKELLEKALTMGMDAKAREAVLTNCLCHSNDTWERRDGAISVLLEQTENIPAGTVETYILRSTTDGANKPEVVKRMLDSGLNLNFFPDLLAQYINTGTDKGEVKQQITALLAERGLKVDSGTFLNYLCNPAVGEDLKIGFTTTMLGNGMALRCDAASIYLEKAGNQFDTELFSLLQSDTGRYSGLAAVQYLLNSREAESMKEERALRILAACSSDPLEISCTVRHLGRDVNCSLLQAYILNSRDSLELAGRIVEQLLRMQFKINGDITVSGEGRMKFKKYVLANRDQLSPLTDQICENYKVYSKLF